MMNYNECLLEEKDKEIAELKAHSKRLESAIEKILDDPNTFRMNEHEEFNDELWRIIEETPAQSLQEHDRQVILDAIEPVQRKFCNYVKAVDFTENQQKFVIMGAEAFRNILRSTANNLTNSEAG